MFILGLQGSPRRKGNCDHLLTTFMAEARKRGARTEVIDVPRREIRPCLELIICEKKGYCPIEDDLRREIYGKIRQADLIVMVSPVFFYAVTAQLKALIDRCQLFWARKYKLRLSDPNAPWRRGYLMAVGASRGKSLFTGMDLTAKYFFDAVDATYEGCLTFSGIEGPNDLKQTLEMPAQVTAAVERLTAPFKNRRRILFTCRTNDRFSQMAAAMAQFKAGDILDVRSAGTLPAETIPAEVAAVMAEKGIDLAFRRPEGLNAVLESWKPEIVVGMDCWEACPYLPGIRRVNWRFDDPVDGSVEALRAARESIEENVTDLIGELRRNG